MRNSATPLSLPQWSKPLSHREGHRQGKEACHPPQVPRDDRDRHHRPQDQEGRVCHHHQEVRLTSRKVEAKCSWFHNSIGPSWDPLLIES